MLIKKSKLVFAFLAILLVGITITTATEAQGQSPSTQNFQNKLKSMLGNFNNVRFSSVSYYELNSQQVRNLKPSILKELNFEEDMSEDSPNATEEVADTVRMNTLVNEVRRLVASGDRNIVQIRRAFNGEKDGFEHLEDLNASDKELSTALNIVLGSGTKKTDIYQMFAITTQSDNPAVDVPDIIALVLVKERIDKNEYEDYLIRYYNEVFGNSLSNEKNILTYPELQNLTVIIDEDTTTLYEQLVIAFQQGNYSPITSEVRGIGTELTFLKTYGKSTSVIANENDVKDTDVQTFVRISDGQPFDYSKQNEIIVSPDYISYRRYPIDYYEDDDGNLVPYNYANANLPAYGAEIKFGLDEINYPSFFSERMMVRAVWDNIKLGVVLPTSGWSSLTKDLFNIDRRLTYGGVGLSGAIDFPIKVIPQSGVFSMSGSYVFGDASKPSYKDRQKVYDEGEFPASYDPNDLFYNDYLIRYTAQAHYTFGFALDESYLLRFGIGATLYGAETWRDYQDTVINDDGEYPILYKKSDDEAVGGISLKVEFMSRDISTPFGVSLQYFDESIYGNAWLQMPIVTDSFFLRFDARGYAAAFKDTVHPWENKSVIMPSVRLIFNF